MIGFFKAARWIISAEIGLIACSATTLERPRLNVAADGSCTAACASFEAAGCPAARGDTRGGTCVSRCEAQLRTRATRPMLGCIASANGNAKEIEKCGERCSR
jgi:hypothetical protein